MAVQVYEDGRWVVSLQADQNAVAVDGAGVPADFSTAEKPQDYTDHLKRNQFVVKVRCFSNYDSKLPGTGRPVVAALCPRPFWVQKAQPLHVCERGVSPEVAEFFDSIYRVELEFSYRVAPYQATKEPEAAKGN